MMFFEIENFVKEFGGFVVIDDVNFIVEEDECVFIIGFNGVGKLMFINFIM